MDLDDTLRAVLSALFMLGVGAPFLLLACRPSSRPAGALHLALGVLAMGVSLAADPLSVALLHVDGVMAMAGCGS